MRQYAVYPQCILTTSLSQARELAREASMKYENEFKARVENTDNERVVLRYEHGEETGR